MSQGLYTVGALILNKILLIYMITIICGTNRPSNETQKFVKLLSEMVTQKGETNQTLLLEDLPHDFAFNNSIYKKENHGLDQIIDTYIEPVNRFIIVSPEYNGSFPGVLKAFIDAIHPKLFKKKKACLIGVGAGRGGNLRGLDHLTGILHYLDVAVLPTKIAIANMHSLTDDSGMLIDEETLKILDIQMNDFIDF